MGNFNLAQVFADTMNQYKTNEKLIEVCKKSRENHKCYKEGETIECEKNRFKDESKIVISKKRTFEACEEYVKNGEKVCALNFANSVHAGGGVVHGARAQEECLCRCSTLYDSLISEKMKNEFYEPHYSLDDIDGNYLANDDVIFTPNVKVFKSDTDIPQIRPENEWFDVDILTCAAPCLEDIDSISDEKLAEIHESRARQILNVACQNKEDVVILGAFGCGAFSNPPEVVAQVYKKVIADYKYAFKTIEFAIYCRDFETRNYKAFLSVIN